VRNTRKVIFTALVLVVAAFSGYRLLFLEAIFYPIWAKNVSASTSQKREKIYLYSGGVTDGEFESKFINGQKSEAELSVPRAYITWAPFLDGKVKAEVSLDAALPDLEPNTIFKARTMKEGESVDADKKYLPDAAHKQWVKIDIGLYGFFNAFCDKSCTREEHIKKSSEYALKNYPILQADSESLGLIHMISNSRNEFIVDGEVYKPVDTASPVEYILCKAPSGKFNWCVASARLNRDMYLRYQFEKSHLAEWSNMRL